MKKKKAIKRSSKFKRKYTKRLKLANEIGGKAFHTNKEGKRVPFPTVLMEG